MAGMENANLREDQKKLIIEALMATNAAVRLLEKGEPIRDMLQNIHERLVQLAKA